MLSPIFDFMGTTLGKIIVPAIMAMVFGMNLYKAIQTSVLARELAISAAKLVGVSASTLGIGTVVVMAAAAAAYAGLAMMAKPKAAGGPITAGNPYLVGEKGPELVVPNASSTVIPNDKLGGSTSGAESGQGWQAVVAEIRALKQAAMQPVIIKLGDKIVNEMDTRLSLRKNIAAGFDNSYGTAISNRS